MRVLESHVSFREYVCALQSPSGPRYRRYDSETKIRGRRAKAHGALQLPRTAVAMRAKSGLVEAYGNAHASNLREREREKESE